MKQLKNFTSNKNKTETENEKQFAILLLPGIGLVDSSAPLAASASLRMLQTHQRH